MKIFFAISVIFSIIGCSGTPKHESIPANHRNIVLNEHLDLWLKSKHYEAKVENDDILVFAKHRFIDSLKYNEAKKRSERVRIELKIADYFFIINKNVDNGLSFLDKDNTNVITLSSGKKKISNILFETETKLFNSVREEKSKIYSLINKGFYSAPDCGLLKSYISSESKLSFYAIDKISCGQLNIEVKLEAYRSEYRKRRKQFSSYTKGLFGLIVKAKG